MSLFITWHQPLKRSQTRLARHIQAHAQDYVPSCIPRAAPRFPTTQLLIQREGARRRRQNVRAARIAFHEKAVAVTFKEIGFDYLANDAYGAINPFRKMPSLTRGELTLYETPALLVYAEGICTGPMLEPNDPAARSKMWQFIGVAQHYLYPVGVMQLYFHNVLAGLFGVTKDEAAAAAAVAPTRLHLDVLERALDSGFLAGNDLSLADVYCGTMVDYIARTHDGRTLIAGRPKLQAWLDSLRRRESFETTFASMLHGSDQPAPQV